MISDLPLRQKRRAKEGLRKFACAIDHAGGLKNPLGLTFINRHRYLNTGLSGTSKDCNTATSRFVKFADQLRRRGLTAYITESALGSHYDVKASSNAVGVEAIAALYANNDALLGITWWGGGRIWPKIYNFKIDPPKAARFTIPTTDHTRSLTGTDISNKIR